MLPKQAVGDAAHVFQPHLFSPTCAVNLLIKGCAAPKLVKTSRTRKMKDFQRRVALCCGRILADGPLPPTLDWLDCWCLPLPRGSHPRQFGSPLAIASSARKTTSSPTVDRPQDVLDCPAKTLVGMERVVGPSHSKNGRGLASRGLPTVLEMALTRPNESEAETV